MRKQLSLKYIWTKKSDHIRIRVEDKDPISLTVFGARARTATVLQRRERILRGRVHHGLLHLPVDPRQGIEAAGHTLQIAQRSVMAPHQLRQRRRIPRHLHRLPHQLRVVEHMLDLRVPLHQTLHLRIGHHHLADDVRIRHETLHHRVVQHLPHHVRIRHHLLLHLALDLGEVGVAEAQVAEASETAAER